MEPQEIIPPRPPRTWIEKFRCAFRGAALGVRGQSSFLVHLCTAVLVVGVGIALRVSFYEWCLLVLCIVGVLTAELFNSALESMARAITHEHNPHLGGALDIASAAVLFASLGSAIIGSVIFLNRLAHLMRWW
jgi:diacylglycerol kinase